jgi:cytochrome c553
MYSITTSRFIAAMARCSLSVTQRLATKRLLTGLMLMLLSNLSAADQGAVLYNQCAACHGQQGQGNTTLKAPALAGLNDQYVIRQLKNFQTGVRGAKSGDQLGAQMRAAVAVLTTEESMAAIARNIQQLTPVKPQDAAAFEGDLRNGSNHYQATCGSCHGSQAQGNVLLGAPALAGQQGDYLIRQYMNYRNGLRGYDSKDRHGRQMKMMSNGLNDQQLQDVVAFILQLNPAVDVASH